MLRIFGAVLAVICCAVVAAGFGAGVHRAGDSLALLRPVAGFGCAVAVVMLRGRWIRGCAALAAIAAAVTVIPVFLPQAPGGDLRIYSKNLWARNREWASVAEDILASDVDVVMLQEVSDSNRAVMVMLQDAFPHQHFCRFSGWSGIAVLSRSAMVGEGLCSTRRGLAGMQISHEGREVWVASVHIHWPWPENSLPAEQAIQAAFDRMEGPVVVAGDFNIFPWTRRVRDVATASGSVLAGPIGATYRVRGLPLPIDMVLAPGGGHVTLRPLLGSDHRGLLADVAIEPR